MSQSIVLIYNPSSGYFIENGIDDPEQYFQAQWDEQAPEGELALLSIETIRNGTLRACLLRIQPDQVWIAGGDGSAIAVAELAVELNIPLGVLPCGTMNLLARDIGMSLDIAQAFQQLHDSDVQLIDMATVNGRRFLCISNLGMSTRLTEQREQLRQQSGWVRWPLMFGYMLKYLFAYPTLDVQIRQGNDVHILRTRSISISNNPLASHSWLIPERKRLDGGKLGIYIIQERSVWSLPRMIFRLFSRDWQDDDDLLHFSADAVRISFRRSSKKVQIMSDGELSQETLPLEYQTLPKALQVLRPKEAL